jgi:hypothetical protein
VSRESFSLSNSKFCCTAISELIHKVQIEQHKN